MLPPEVRSAFAPTVTYLSTASYGLMPSSVTGAVTKALQEREAGTFDIPALDDDVHACRAIFGRLTGFEQQRVAIGANASQLVGVVAEGLPTGSSVVTVEDEFTSVTWPFLARAAEGLKVRSVPLRDLATAVRPDDDLVAVAPVQSADGAVADIPGIVDAAHAVGARVLLDASQAAGWLPLQDCGADWVVCVGYKWLLGPKGTAFLASTEEAAAAAEPTAAGWYAGDDPWESIYADHLSLARDGRRFDVSPAWEAWVGQRLAMELIEAIGVDAIHRHDVELADRLRAGLGLPPGNSAVVSVPVEPDVVDRLEKARVVAAMRNGRLRLAFHIYNTVEDVDRALDLLT
jgi:selenocysteine lyase/cysteine desulfurase